MTFTTGTLTRCPGQNHYNLPITIAGVTRVLRFGKEEFEGEPPANIEEARDAILDRVRSAAKEANATTFAQAKTAVEGKTFKI